MSTSPALAYEVQEVMMAWWKGVNGSHMTFEASMNVENGGCIYSMILFSAKHYTVEYTKTWTQLCSRHPG